MFWAMPYTFQYTALISGTLCIYYTKIQTMADCVCVCLYLSVMQEYGLFAIAVDFSEEKLHSILIQWNHHFKLSFKDDSA
jgi:hypothetical protein